VNISASSSANRISALVREADRHDQQRNEDDNEPERARGAGLLFGGDRRGMKIFGSVDAVDMRGVVVR
jgi:hypothetical protein